MANLGITQLLLIALIVVFIFGATRLPELGRVLGSALARAKRSGKDVSKKNPSESRRELTA